MKKLIFFPVCLIFLLSLFSCASSAALDEEGLSPAEYFQKAYKASDNKNYKLAIRYYEAFQAKYPDEVERNIWAEYEIAFTYYKMGNMEKADELFTLLIARYDEEGSVNFPPGPLALAEKVLAEIKK